MHLRVLRSLESWLGSALVLGALLLFLLGMLFRGLSIPIGGGWITEVTIYLVVWGLLLSAAGCVAQHEHIRVDFFLRLTGKRFRHFADILATCAGLAFCAAMTWYGWKVAAFAVAWDERGLSYLQLPMAWYYAALPVSMALCSLRYVIELFRLMHSGHRIDHGG